MTLRSLLTPKTIYAQIVVVVVLALVIVITAAPMIERWIRDDFQTPDIENLADRLQAVASILAVATPNERETLIAVVQRSGWDITLEPLSLMADFKEASKPSMSPTG